MDQQEAQKLLAENLELLARAGMEAAGQPVQAEVEEGAWFPTKQYNDFALPAGRYPALKLTLGEGEGRNWWCVVFPPLCMGAVTETVAERAEEACFSGDQIKLITGEDEGYVVRFKLMELWNQLTERIAGE